MPEKRNEPKTRKRAEAGAVVLSEEDLDQARGGGTLSASVIEPSAVTVRGWDPVEKKAFTGEAKPQDSG